MRATETRNRISLIIIYSQFIFDRKCRCNHTSPFFPLPRIRNHVVCVFFFLLCVCVSHQSPKRFVPSFLTISLHCSWFPYIPFHFAYSFPLLAHFSAVCMSIHTNVNVQSWFSWLCPRINVPNCCRSNRNPKFTSQALFAQLPIRAMLVCMLYYIETFSKEWARDRYIGYHWNTLCGLCSNLYTHTKNHNQNKAHIVPMLSANIITRYIYGRVSEWHRIRAIVAIATESTMTFLCARKSRQIYRQ